MFDATANLGSIEAGFAYAAHGGRYVVSVVKGDIAFTDADFHRKELTLLGSRNATTEDFDRVGAFRSGHIRSEDWITRRTEDAIVNLPRWASDKRGLIKGSPRPLVCLRGAGALNQRISFPYEAARRWDRPFLL